MSELFDTGQFACGDPAALVTYIYGECSEPERQVIAAHLAHCAACAEEVATLGSTRQQLAAWGPPDHALGFQITRAEAAAASAPAPPPAAVAATVVRPPRWWNQPLPAWAQMAAAVAIFGAGLTIGTARSGAPPAPAGVPGPAAPPSAVSRAPVAATTAAVSHEELVRLEQRLRSEMAQIRTAAPATASADDQAVLRRVSQLIAASEERQQRELAFRTSQVVNDISNARRIDLLQIDQRLNNFERATGRRVETNQQDIRSLAQTVAYTLK